jgi:hypothetical protein
MKVVGETRLTTFWIANTKQLSAACEATILIQVISFMRKTRNTIGNNPTPLRGLRSYPAYSDRLFQNLF